MFNFASLLVAATAVTAVVATHTITLTNNCGSGVPVWVDSTYSPVPYVSYKNVAGQQERLIDVWYYRLEHSLEQLARVRA